MNIPNILTLLRFILVPVFVIVFFSTSPDFLTKSFIVFLIAGATDVLDGYIARKFNLITKLGTLMDPLADKLMLLTVLYCFVAKGLIPTWVVMIMLISEFLMISGGIYLYFFNDKHAVSSNIYGKLATFLFYIVVIMVVFISQSTVTIYFLGFAVAIKIWALMNYALGFKKLLSDK